MRHISRLLLLQLTDPSEDVTFDNRPIEDFGQRFILGDGCSDQVTAYTYCAPSINAFMVITIICPLMWIKCRHQRCSQPLQMCRDKTFFTGSSLDKLFLDSTFASSFFMRCLMRESFILALEEIVMEQVRRHSFQ